MDKWLKTGSTLRNSIKTRQVSYPECCGDDWCLNGPPHVLADTYFLCYACSRGAEKASINATEWGVRLKSGGPRVTERKPILPDDFGLEQSEHGEGCGSTLTMQEMEEFVQEYCDCVYNLDWKDKAKFFQWKLCIEDPIPDTKLVYKKGRKEDLERWSRFLDRKGSL